MKEITTVKVYTVVLCSHSATHPYKNLPQQDCTATALLQLGPTAGAEGEDNETGHGLWRSSTAHKHTELNNNTQLHVGMDSILLYLNKLILL